MWVFELIHSLADNCPRVRAWRNLIRPYCLSDGVHVSPCGTKMTPIKAEAGPDSFESYTF
jgi:hypothetical protein